VIKAELHEMYNKFNVTTSHSSYLRELTESVKSLTGLRVLFVRKLQLKRTPCEDGEVEGDKLKVNSLYSQACLEDFTLFREQKQNHLVILLQTYSTDALCFRRPHAKLQKFCLQEIIVRA